MTGVFLKKILLECVQALVPYEHDKNVNDTSDKVPRLIIWSSSNATAGRVHPSHYCASYINNKKYTKMRIHPLEFICSLSASKSQQAISSALRALRLLFSMESMVTAMKLSTRSDGMVFDVTSRTHVCIPSEIFLRQPSVDMRTTPAGDMPVYNP